MVVTTVVCTEVPTPPVDIVVARADQAEIKSVLGCSTVPPRAPRGVQFASSLCDFLLLVVLPPLVFFGFGLGISRSTVRFCVFHNAFVYSLFVSKDGKYFREVVRLRVSGAAFRLVVVLDDFSYGYGLRVSRAATSFWVLRLGFASIDDSRSSYGVYFLCVRTTKVFGNSNPRVCFRLLHFGVAVRFSNSNSRLGFCLLGTWIFQTGGFCKAISRFLVTYGSRAAIIVTSLGTVIVLP